MPMALGMAAPSTPPRTKPRALERELSCEKVENPRHRRADDDLSVTSISLPLHRHYQQEQQSSPQGVVLVERTALTEGLVSSSGLLATETEQARGGEEKYWTQVRHAHRLLVNSIQAELAVAEVVRSNRSVFAPLLQGAADAQDADRLDAAAMLSLLNEMVVEADAFNARSRPLPGRTPKRPLDTQPVAPGWRSEASAPCALRVPTQDAQGPAPHTPPATAAPGTPTATPARRPRLSKMLPREATTPPAVQRRSRGGELPLTEEQEVPAKPGKAEPVPGLAAGRSP